MKSPFALLKPLALKPRPTQVLALGEPFDWVVRERRSRSEPMALDFETKGDWGQPATYPVGAALSDSRGSVYIPFSIPQNGLQCPHYSRLIRLLKDERVPLLAHNVPFDGGWPVRDFGSEKGWLNWRACTYATYKLCASEGFDGQRWGLKHAMVDLLGWPESNEAGIEEWLVQHKYVTTISKVPKPGHLPFDNGKGTARWARPDKGEMHRVPVSILGPYACMDADACWQMWTYVLEPCLKAFPVLRDYVLDWYPTYMKLLIEQKRRGILIDAPALDLYKKELELALQIGYSALSGMPEVESCISDWNAACTQKVAQQEPPRYEPIQLPGKEPQRLTKGGSISKSWTRWDAKRAAAEELQARPELRPCTYRWLKWEARMEAVVANAAALTLFNWNSGKHRAWLFYDKLGHKVLVKTKKGGKPATSGDALLGFGAPGKVLSELQDKEKVRQFCEQTLSLLTHADTIHPGFRVPGTLTGRLSGRDPNVQQAPADKRYLDCWKARPGFKLVACDVVSLENYVLAEMSRDPALWGLYGPDAMPGQDAYLYNAAQMPIIGPKIQKTGYDPATATPEQTAAAKKACKVERMIGKTFTLSANYGAGPRKIRDTLRLQAGIDLPLRQVEEMHEGFWDLYSGIQSFQAVLTRLWHKNAGAGAGAGWVLNGIGRPVGCDGEYLKDIVNRVIQSTGHDLLVKKVLISKALLDAAGIEAYPWIVDLHDAEYWEVREDQAEQARELIEKKAYEQLNAWMNSTIKLKGEATLTDTWGGTKE